MTKHTLITILRYFDLRKYTMWTMGDKKDRRGFLATAAAAGTGLALAACSDRVEQKEVGSHVNFNKTYHWKVSTSWPPHFPILGQGVEHFAKWVKQMTGGRMEISVYGSGELVKGGQLFDAVSRGAIEMGHACPYYWAGKIPAAQFFAGVPFGMNAQQTNAWLLNGGGMELWEELYADSGLKPFLAGNTGVQMGGWFNKEINTIEDIQGMKMRIPGLGGKVWAEAGGTAMSVAGGEIYTNLERGVIDATEWIGPYNDYTMGFHEVAKYYYYPGWHEPGTVLELMINKEKFEELPSDIQAIIKAGSHQVHNWIFMESETQNNRYLKKILEPGKVKLKQFPPEVLAAFKKAADKVCGEISSKNPFATKTWRAYQEFRENAAEWSKVTEKPFYELIQR